VPPVHIRALPAPRPTPLILPGLTQDVRYSGDLAGPREVSPPRRMRPRDSRRHAVGLGAFKRADRLRNNVPLDAPRLLLLPRWDGGTRCCICKQRRRPGLPAPGSPPVHSAQIDRVQDHGGQAAIPVRALAERVIELYWPQTLPYQTTGQVLRQSQSGGQAAIVTEIVKFRELHAGATRALPELVRRDPPWVTLVTTVEEALAERPIPRLQRPYEPFLYAFDWSWEDDGRWSARRYRTSSRTITMFPGVGGALTSLGPLLRPFITRWWTDKAAQLNPGVEAARSVIEFEDFLFGRDRIALERIGEGLLDLQYGDCFYCHTRIASRRQIDHFIPWSHSGDDGLDNLVAACHTCNNRKRATLAGPEHLGGWCRSTF
jgi:hypothetical protein